jgi:hypothetical protein
MSVRRQSGRGTRPLRRPDPTAAASRAASRSGGAKSLTKCVTDTTEFVNGAEMRNRIIEHAAQGGHAARGSEDGRWQSVIARRPRNVLLTRAQKSENVPQKDESTAQEQHERQADACMMRGGENTEARRRPESNYKLNPVLDQQVHEKSENVVARTRMRRRRASTSRRSRSRSEVGGCTCMR